MFVDRVQIEVQAGKGGDGCMSFRREKFVPKGGPDGGDGGDGGSIIIEARGGVDHLSALAHRKLWRAPKGKNGSGANNRARASTGVQTLIRRNPGPKSRSRLPSTLLVCPFTHRQLLSSGVSSAARMGTAAAANSSFPNSHSAAVAGPTQIHSNQRSASRTGSQPVIAL